MLSITRIKRGMVFWYNPFPQEEEKAYHSLESGGRKYRSYVQAGHRPWVVVSCDESNAALPVCSIVPLTTADRYETPIHASFEYKNKKEIVLTEQIITVDSYLLREYEGFVSQEVMDKIDEALAIQLGLRRMPLAEVVTEQVEEVKEEEEVPAVAVVTEVVEEVVAKIVVPEKKERKNRKWTEEDRREFILDCRNLTSDEVMEKYGFTHPRQIAQKKYVIKKLLGIE